jgi:glucose-6-phosphate 1-epimerase
MTAITMVEYGKLPAVQLAAADGARAIVTLYGAHLVSWHSADGRERLFCSTRSALDGSAAIRGGVPVIFPQFSERGSGMRHGFARVSTWRLGRSGSEDGAAFAVFELAQADLAAPLAQAWPHRFALELRVTVRANELRLALEVRNTGSTAFAFASALHTYHLVGQVADVRIDGVQDTTLAIGDTLDRIYNGIGGEIILRSGADELRLRQSGFPDAVVWNPGAAGATALADMGDDEYQRFVCIEPALVDQIPLPAGQAWQGRHSMVAAGRMG